MAGGVILSFYETVIRSFREKGSFFGGRRIAKFGRIEAKDANPIDKGTDNEN